MKKATGILIDASRSMGREFKKDLQKYLIENNTRMDLAKEILCQIITPSIFESERVIIQTFKSDNQGENPVCELICDTEFHSTKVNEAIMSVADPIFGGTPITEGITKSTERLTEYADYQKTLIVITDGEENGGGDYVVEAKRIGQYKICTMHIIGLGLDTKLGNNAQKAANLTGGTFTNIELKPSDTFEAIFTNAKQKLSDLQQILNSKQQDVTDENITILEDAQRNEKIRLASETYLYKWLLEEYGERVYWLNEHGESNSNHDFELMSLTSSEPNIFIECKGTPATKRTFYLTGSEWELALEQSANYRLYFVQNCFDKKPKINAFSDILDELAKKRLLPYSLEEEQVQPKRITLTLP
jgi:hypothetical protein